jgi:hypothetical protein
MTNIDPVNLPRHEPRPGHPILQPALGLDGGPDSAAHEQHGSELISLRAASIQTLVQ